MLHTEKLADLVLAGDAFQRGTLTRERYDAIIDALTPEERALWEEICPAIFDSDVVLKVADAGGGWKD
jgi:hypothetical protein